MPMPEAIIIIIVCAFVLGALTNGLLIGYFGVNFFIVTLGTLTITQGIALQITGGNDITMYNEKWLLQVANNNVFGFPILGLVGLAILILGILVLRYTGFGRMVYSVGGNPEAARLSGISVARVRLTTYAISAGLAALAGILEVGRLASSGPTTDTSIELTGAAAVLIGGVAFGGGIGTLLGTFLGVAFLGVLQSGLLISGISSYWQGIITGIVLIVSVTVDRMRARRASTRKLKQSEDDQVLGNSGATASGSAEGAL
jgi:ribose transport system permease protein